MVCQQLKPLRYVSFTSSTDGCVIDVKRGPAPSFRVDVDGIERAVAEHNPKILFLTSPNNPDGSVLDESDLERLLCLPVLVVLDEAYVEFSSSYTSRIAEVPNRKNLIVLRTFSKRAGLAGELLAVVDEVFFTHILHYAKESAWVTVLSQTN